MCEVPLEYESFLQTEDDVVQAEVVSFRQDHHPKLICVLADSTEGT